MSCGGRLTACRYARGRRRRFWLIQALARAIKKRHARFAAQFESAERSGDPGALERFVTRLAPEQHVGLFWAAARAGEAGLATSETALVQAAMVNGIDAIKAIRTVREWEERQRQRQLAREETSRQEWEAETERRVLAYLFERLQ